MGNKRIFGLDRIVFYGRTYPEYLAIFGFDEENLADKIILDCCAGASSFTETAHKKGMNVTALDPLYGLDPLTISSVGETDVEHVMEKLADSKDQFNWEYYGSMEERKRLARSALLEFSEGYPEGALKGRYVNGELPVLPFRDNHFDLAICAHFLFTYSDRFEYRFILASTLELMRVTKERVLIYPLLGTDGAEYVDLARLRADLANKGVETSTKRTRFSFQKGANLVLELNE